MSGTKYMLSHPFFFMKKHYCPKCNVKLNVIKDSKIVNSNSVEAKGYDFSLGDTYLTGDVKFIFKVLECPSCYARFTRKDFK